MYFMEQVVEKQLFVKEKVCLPFAGDSFKLPFEIFSTKFPACWDIYITSVLDRTFLKNCLTESVSKHIICNKIVNN